jgi:hypothetical protein
MNRSFATSQKKYVRRYKYRGCGNRELVVMATSEPFVIRLNRNRASLECAKQTCEPYAGARIGGLPAIFLPLHGHYCDGLLDMLSTVRTPEFGMA